MQSRLPTVGLIGIPVHASVTLRALAEEAHVGPGGKSAAGPQNLSVPQSGQTATGMGC